ncbi:MAG: TonB-dependent receptor [Bacteroidetes bacterium]|jgi:outer membrane receptor protein involved in Fe transport|nr:TonB-dependent receptor [Bacteroidota bacterium]
MNSYQVNCFIFTILGALLFSNGLGQNARQISGFVLTETGSPVYNAKVLNGGTHVHTGRQGEFVLTGVLTGDSLIVEHLYYKNKIYVVLAEDSIIYIQLSQTELILENIEVEANLDALNNMSQVDLNNFPVNSSQDLLRLVPGLTTGQHAGGGKAEQIFLRGFDVDHGTDVAISTDGLPVNMVSHAHGQGYADLHFLIPETVEKLDWGKGPYEASKGDFATAGYVNFSTRRQLDSSLIRAEAGMFGHRRILAMLKLADRKEVQSYLATEYQEADGPFESSQNLNRINGFGKITFTPSHTDLIGLTASHFFSSWDASGQIPQRAIDSGTISRFGAIDDTEGGITQRSQISVDHDKWLSDHSRISNKLFYTHYNFLLYSNFTFYLNDPVNGDQIRQREQRNMIGMQSVYQHDLKLLGFSVHTELGLYLRHDNVNNTELSRTKNRDTTLSRIQYGDIRQTNYASYFSTKLTRGCWVVSPAIRVDYLDFLYRNALEPTYNPKSNTAALLSPKLSILYSPARQVQLFLKAGKGFHSNSAQVATQQDAKKTLPAAYSADLGYIWKPGRNLFVSMAYWHLFLEQEFVYVGDEGIVEPAGKTERQGAELDLRYQPLRWLIANLDATYTFARLTEATTGEDRIPLAPTFTLTGSLSARMRSGMYASIRMRNLADRPANEKNSVVARGYTIFGLSGGYQAARLGLELQIENLFDVDWNETQFSTLTRLKDETEPVEEIHFTPGTPLSVRAQLTYRF